MISIGRSKKADELYGSMITFRMVIEALELRRVKCYDASLPLESHQSKRLG